MYRLVFVRLFVCLFVSEISRTLRVDFGEIWGISSIWTTAELTKLQKLRLVVVDLGFPLGVRSGVFSDALPQLIAKYAAADALPFQKF